MTNSKRSRILRAGIWTVGGDVASQVIRLGSNLIMTRLLVPEMFGVMAIVSVVLIGLTMFSDLGLRQSIIRSHRGDEPIFLDTAWVVQIVRGITLWIIGLILSVLIYWFAHAGFVASGTVYAKPELPLVLAIVSFSAVITGLESTRVATAGRYLAQGRLTFMEISSQLSGVAIMLIWAMISRSVWALVIGGLFTNIVKTIMSHLILPGVHNRWRYERDAFHEIFHFGKWIFISSVFSFLIINGDRILLSGLISAEDLGIYVIACFIVGAITHMAGKLMTNVSFPVLSETARNKPDLLKYAYYRFRIPFDLVLFSLAGLLFFSGRHIIEFLYDPRYLRAGEMLEILSISIIALRYTMIDQCFMAMGMPKLMATMNIIKAFGLFIMLPIAYNAYGMTGALWGIVLSSFTSVPLTLYYKHKLKMLDVVKEIFPTPFFLGGMMVGAFINWLL